ncbi:hypothetical protein BaRGS_00039215 [Batillaria attramentaria]|uniref:Uncharacterized protein n=1 Tax=Batillaria attramentaria TaxID=370345 RepID=A0ABD0J4B4_9CAEN
MALSDIAILWQRVGREKTGRPKEIRGRGQAHGRETSRAAGREVLETSGKSRCSTLSVATSLHVAWRARTDREKTRCNTMGHDRGKLANDSTGTEYLFKFVDGCEDSLETSAGRILGAGEI